MTVIFLLYELVIRNKLQSRPLVVTCKFILGKRILWGFCSSLCRLTVRRQSEGLRESKKTCDFSGIGFAEYISAILPT